MNLKKIGKLFTSKFVGPGPSSYKKIIYRAAVSQRLRNTGLHRYTHFTCCTASFVSSIYEVNYGFRHKTVFIYCVKIINENLKLSYVAVPVNL
jgi:hypothetical protein